MDTYNSNCEYKEFDDNPSLYLSVTESLDEPEPLDNELETLDSNNKETSDFLDKLYSSRFNSSINRNKFNESSTFRSINLDDPTDIKNTHDIWKPNVDDSWSLRHQPKGNTYYDTDKISNSIDDTKTVLRKHIGTLNDRKSKLNNLTNLTEMLTQNANKFQINSRKLKCQQLKKYALHIIGISVIIILIITLIVILVKS
jgi:hypothetical protein